VLITRPRPTTIGSHRPARTAPVVAGATYVGAWLAGLGAHPSGVDLRAGADEIVRHYAAHGAGAAISSLLVHGIAAGALAVVVTSVHRHRTTHASAARARLYRVGGLTAVTVSLAQMLVGLLLALRPTVATADTLFDALNRLDGLKLVVLAGVAVAAVRLDLPGWVRRLGLPLAATLLVSGVGFLLLDSGLATVAAPALFLLLVWVAASGVAASR
jgi:hypothetical protein